METDNAVYKTLLESTKAIPWKIEWSSLKFTYIGPQIEALLGWKPESWISVEDWASRMHPEDREWVVNYCVAQSQAGTDHEADYRALTSSGDYVWIRDVVHVARKENGEVDSLIGFMFDISERKKTEQELLTLQKKLEELSFKDGLTGIANRRMFDSILETEWADARRNQSPISLIMLDIDYFKQYNDEYGHIQGDVCLTRVAGILNSASSRPRDFVARIGGEEFAIILPETDEASARKVAERCRIAIEQEKIPHAKSGVSDYLTLSMGLSTAIPGQSDTALSLVEQADKSLYQAKNQGRDRIHDGS
ncbi:MAG: sensor domain-containing diguanylate cyclase [Betaproteobacteria bacterium HGW-Betaproteobacteria-1]|nr:MAG: sensor domain-containing diguanylate cyclase [Betaproteobacteria bacterium HGW-Betaproteobacteria-1]